VALGAWAKTITLTNGAILNPTITSNPTATTKSFVVGTGGATFNVANAVTFQLDDANQFSGTGDLTVTGAGTGAVFLNNQAFAFSGNVFVNSGTLRLGANAGVLGASAGRTVTVASGAVVDASSHAAAGVGINAPASGRASLINAGTAARASADR
jgi:autotransporter-associated beta strand protein